MKTGDGAIHREFESHTLRQIRTVILIPLVLRLRFFFAFRSPFLLTLHEITPNQEIVRLGVAAFRVFSAPIIVKTVGYR